MREKALLAVMLAAGVVGFAQSAIAVDAGADEQSESIRFSIHSVAENKEIAPADRAYRLVLFANQLQNGGSASDAQVQLLRDESTTYRRSLEEGSSKMSALAYSICRSAKSPVRKGVTSSIQRRELAVSALTSAVALAPGCDRKSAMPIYQSAGSLFEALNKTESARQCDEQLEKLIKQCEEDKNLDVEEVRAAAAALNTMGSSAASFSFWGRNAAKTFSKTSDEEFRRNERYRLRALTLLDRLPASDHQRRLGHRDLAVMYAAQGETELADKQKQVLFDLVGIADDSILNPQNTGCGQITWWRIKKVSTGMLCGMG